MIICRWPSIESSTSSVRTIWPMNTEVARAKSSSWDTVRSQEHALAPQIARRRIGTTRKKGTRRMASFNPINHQQGNSGHELREGGICRLQQGPSCALSVFERDNGQGKGGSFTNGTDQLRSSTAHSKNCCNT